MGEYGSISPLISQARVCKILMNLLSRNNRISGDITFATVLLDRIKQLGSNLPIFGVKSKKEL